MTPCTSRTAGIALILCMAAAPVWGQQYLLYAPQSAAVGQKVSPKDGVLVTEIEVQKGDSLYEISRKYSGRGMYYPQILLFNSIKNPNLIYPGNTLKIPVTQHEVTTINATAKQGNAPKTAPASGKKNVQLKTEAEPGARLSSGKASVRQAQSTEISLSDLKIDETTKAGKTRHKKKTAGHVRKSKLLESQVVSPLAAPLPAAHKGQDASASGQKLFEAAVKAYRLDDCRTALELLDRYLSDNSGSPLAADANLYKAECYLKLSAQ